MYAGGSIASLLRAGVIASLAAVLVLSPAQAEGDPEAPLDALPGEAIAEEAGDEELVWDPLEPVNRGIWAFNDALDAWLLEPVAIGWDFVLPRRVQLSVNNFFSHLVLPVRIVNDLLQLKPVKALEDGGRFVVNTLVGVGGLFDPASAGGIPRHDEDFGQTLGHWGVPPGPYLVLPVLGPSNPRDGVGLAVDSAMAVQSFFVSFPILAGAAVVDAVNTRSLTIEEVRAEREAAFDFYVAVRAAYTQFREHRVHDRSETPEEPTPDEDLYYFDEEYDEELENE
jgi:phospholipid-binding lipoprotein MlaA